MHLNARDRIVHIARTVLIEELTKNLALHEAQYAEAVEDYRTKLRADLHAAELAVVHGTTPLDKISVKFEHPKSYAQEYRDALDVLSYEQRDILPIDGQTFKAWVKNEWTWSESFRFLNASYKFPIRMAGVSAS